MYTGNFITYHVLMRNQLFQCSHHICLRGWGGVSTQAYSCILTSYHPPPPRYRSCPSSHHMYAHLIDLNISLLPDTTQPLSRYLMYAHPIQSSILMYSTPPPPSSWYLKYTTCWPHDTSHIPTLPSITCEEKQHTR